MSERDRLSQDEVARRLDELAERERDDVSAAGALADAPGEDRVDGTLDRLWATAEPPSSDDPLALPSPDLVPMAHTTPPTGARPVLGWLAVAAALVLVSLLWFTGDDGETETVMLGDGLRLSTPVGSADSWAPIEWEHPAPAGLTFSLRVVDPTRSDPSGVLLQTPRRAELRWDDPDAAVRWPERIVVEIDAYDGSGNLVDSLADEVSRSSR